MSGNATGGRKEATGVWAWKLDTLEPGQTYTITYTLSGLEKGDWTETDVFYRGSQEVIGASKMDEKLLEEIRRQEAREEESPDGEEIGDASTMEPESAEEALQAPEDEPPKSTGQQTLMGYGSDA